MSQIFYQELGHKLRAFRKHRNMTLVELADLLHKSVATVSKYENGEINLAIDVLIDICSILNIDIAECLPSTYKDESNVDILKYEKHFVDKLYMYWYNGESKRIKTAIIENSNLAMKSIIYFGIQPNIDYHQSEFTYHGTVSYSDTSMTFTYTNEDPPFDKVFIRVPLLFAKDHYQMGIMSCITYYYQGVTAKVLLSKKPLTINDSLKSELLIDTDDIKELKRTNFLIIK